MTVESMLPFGLHLDAVQEWLSSIQVDAMHISYLTARLKSAIFLCAHPCKQDHHCRGGCCAGRPAISWYEMLLPSRRGV